MQEIDEQAQLILQVADLDEIGVARDAATDSLQRDLERGLRFAHQLMSITQHEGREGVIFARALAEVLVDKGIIEQQELEAMMAKVEKQFAELPTPQVMLGRGADKYTSNHTVAIDCASRIHLCKARCCSFAFFLTEQDLDEGIVRWDYGQPYWIKRGEDGYCVHCQPGNRMCQIHHSRPYVCRAYDCSKDKRIWLDFEGMVVNPETVSGK